MRKLIINLNKYKRLNPYKLNNWIGIPTIIHQAGMKMPRIHSLVLLTLTNDFSDFIPLILKYFILLIV